MKDTWCRQAQEHLENLTARFTIAELDAKQSEKGTLQVINGDWIIFQMLLR
jgi:hypothetical protein